MNRLKVAALFWTLHELAMNICGLIIRTKSDNQEADLEADSTDGFSRIKTRCAWSIEGITFSNRFKR